MPDAYLEDLKRRIASGEYAVDSATLADVIITKMAVVRRVRRVLAGEAEQDAAAKPSSSDRERPRRGSRPTPGQQRRSRGRLQ